MTTENVNLFEQATRQKLRFNTQVGQLTVEDLWTLPLTSNTGKVNLDSIAVELNKQLKGTEESFVNNTKKNTLVQLQFDVVKHILETRVAENTAKTQAAQRKAQNDKIDELIAQKQEESLRNLSIEELQALKG